MTLLVSWIGADNHGTTSAYILSDSRISWGESISYDYGKKVFASSLYPEILGYAGDVLFPSIVLSQIVELIDANVLFSKSLTCSEKNRIIFEKIQHSFSKYPNESIVLGESPIRILHISRETEFDGYPRFSHYKITWDQTHGWKRQEDEIPDYSAILCVLGSGYSEFIEKYKVHQTGNNKNTTRNIFHCFIKTLKNINDSSCGGAPQMVGLYRKPLTAGLNFGLIYKNKRYILGMEVPDKSAYHNIDWRNERFEISDGETRKIREGAKKQPGLQ